MSKKSKINLTNLIELSSFDVTRDEAAVIEKELEDFLQYAEIINSAPCEDRSPASHAVHKEQLLRSDTSPGRDNRSELLRKAPRVTGTSYLVPPQKGRAGSDDEAQEPGTDATTSDFETVIGLEVHAQLKTSSKLFCSCSASFGSEANANTCPVCAGHPGVLPVLNKEAVSMAIMAGLAMNCTINEHSLFERKNYFYPDLPKGYQISQFEEPLCSSGSINIEVDGEKKTVRLNRIHMEEDAGKMVHVGAPGIWGSKASAVDFNRCSVPLIEIVSEPDMSSAREAREYVTMLRAILVSLDICDGIMEEGSLRCDANISLRPRGSKELGVKTEIKNMNSFKAIEKAIDFEVNRQIKLLSRGIKISQETRLWDESSQKTYLMRSKEESHDYRYFPDPDLLPLKVTRDWINSLRGSIPPMPLDVKKRCMDEFGLDEQSARLFMTNPSYYRYFNQVMEHYHDPARLANWFFTEVLSYLNESINDIHITPKDMADFLNKIDSGEISGKIGKAVMRESFESGRSLVDIIRAKGLRQITDTAEIEALVDAVLEKHVKQVCQYRDGNTKVFGFLVGQAMKESGGKANPALVNELLKKKLDA